MTWITLPFVFGASPWQISWLNDDFSEIVTKLNAFNPTGAPVSAGGASSVRGLVGHNNTGTPATQYDLTADFVVARSPSDGSIFAQTPVPTVTNDITLAGPIINGRDQGVSFSASSWIHLYLIADPVNNLVNSISSATPPPTGPALPGGYTAWAYAGAFRLDGSTNFVATVIRGATVSYVLAQNTVNTSATAINTETPVDVSAVVPPNALSFLLSMSASIVNNALSQWSLVTLVVTGQDYHLLRGSVGPSHNALSAQLTVPNVGQQYAYLWNVDTPSAPTTLDETAQWVNGYRIPNGDA